MRKFIAIFLIFAGITAFIFFKKSSVYEYISVQINSGKVMSWDRYAKQRVKLYQKITRIAADEFLAETINGDYDTAQTYWNKPIISIADKQEKTQFDKKSRTISDILNKIKNYEHVDSWVWVIKVYIS